MYVIVVHLHHNFDCFLQPCNGYYLYAFNRMTWFISFRHDRLFKTVFGGFTQTLLAVWNGANFASQPNLSENHQISRQRTVAKT